MKQGVTATVTLIRLLLDARESVSDKSFLFGKISSIYVRYNQNDTAPNHNRKLKGATEVNDSKLRVAKPT